MSFFNGITVGEIICFFVGHRFNSTGAEIAFLDLPGVHYEHTCVRCGYSYSTMTVRLDWSSRDTRKGPKLEEK